MGDRKRWVAAAVGCLVTAVVVSACGSSGSSTKPGAAATGSGSSGAKPAVGLKVSYPGAAGNDIPVWVGADQGIFAKNQLNVSLQTISSASAQVSAVTSGSTDIAFTSGAAALSAAAAGSEIVIISNVMPVYHWEFYARPGITSLEQLKGKKIGITTASGSFATALRLALPKKGLPLSDVTFVTTGSIANVTAALIAGSIDGAAIEVGPDSLTLERTGYKSLFDFAEIGVSTCDSVFVASKSFVASHPDQVQNFVTSLKQSVAFMKTEPAKTKETLGKYFKTSDESLIDYTYMYYAAAIPDLPTLNVGQFGPTVTTLIASNPKVGKLDIAKLIDNSFDLEAAKH